MKAGIDREQDVADSGSPTATVVGSLARPACGAGPARVPRVRSKRTWSFTLACVASGVPS